MRNFELRPSPNFSNIASPPFADDDKRLVDVGSDDTGASLTFSKNINNGAISFGIAGHNADHNSVITDPDFAPFEVVNFNNAEADQLSAFTEWQGSFKSFEIELGTRYQRIKNDADEISISPATLPPAVALQNRFNSSDRSQTDHNLDLVAKFAYPLNDEFTLINASTITFRVSLQQTLPL